MGSRTWQTRTHWRSGTRGMTWSSRWAAVWAMRLAPQDGQKPTALAAERHQLVVAAVAAVAAAQAQEAAGQHGAA